MTLLDPGLDWHPLGMWWMLLRIDAWPPRTTLTMGPPKQGLQSPTEVPGVCTVNLQVRMVAQRAGEAVEARDPLLTCTGAAVFVVNCLSPSAVVASARVKQGGASDSFAVPSGTCTSPNQLWPVASGARIDVLPAW